MKFSTLKWSALSGLALSLALVGGCSKEETPAGSTPPPATGAPSAPSDTTPPATGVPSTPSEGMPPAAESKPSEAPKEATPAPAPEDKKETEPKKD